MKLTLCIDKQPKTNPSNELKTYEINIGNRLCSYDNVYDELIITLNDVNQLEGIIKRRCNIDRFDVITKLQEEYTQTLEIPEITLFEGTNYVYLQDFNYLNMRIEYLTNVEMNKHFAKTEEFNSALVLTAQEFNLRLSQKLDGNEFTHASIVAKINDDTSEVQIEADKISLAGKEIDLTSDDIVIESTNFSVDKDGKITATAGDIGGFNLNSTQFYKNLNGLYNYSKYDLISVQAYILGVIQSSSYLQRNYDVNDDNVINAGDLLKIQKILLGLSENTKNVQGRVEINSENPKNCLSVYSNNNELMASVGVSGISAENITGRNLILGNPNSTSDDYSKIVMSGDSGIIYCVSVQQSSLESKKKNFQKLDNALDIIKNIDIYKYNMKTDKDNEKKHIGFVIGDKYNYSKEVTSKENDGVDLYSFISVCCKAIQEQQKEIKQLQERIERLESDK